MACWMTQALAVSRVRKDAGVQVVEWVGLTRKTPKQYYSIVGEEARNVDKQQAIATHIPAAEPAKYPAFIA